MKRIIIYGPPFYYEILDDNEEVVIKMDAFKDEKDFWISFFKDSDEVIKDKGIYINKSNKI